jgi:hypothetical protein
MGLACWLSLNAGGLVKPCERGSFFWGGFFFVRPLA